MTRGRGALRVCVLLLAAAAVSAEQSGRALLQQTVSPPAANCFDRPTPEGFTCEQQKGWGKCSERWMVDGGFCRRTCNLCSLPTPPVAEGSAQGPLADDVQSVEAQPPVAELPSSSAFCTQPSVTGPCRSAMPAWFWDNEAATCRPFLYGGCQGNDNRFDRFEVCQAAAERFCFSGP